MTTTTKTSTGPKALPWGRYSEVVDRQIAAHTTPAQIEAAYQDYLAGQRTERVVSGVPTYRDGARGESYTVGYGGERHYPVNPPRAVKMATEPQKSYLRSLVAKVGRLSGHVALDLDTEIDAMTGREASAAIDRCLATLKAAPAPAPVEVPATPAAPARARLNFAEILDGNYAVGTDTENDPIKFYRVSTGKNGFKNVQVRASDELFDLSAKAGIAVMHKIVALGLQESRMLFSTRLERCFTCYRTLTDKDSREAGQGPECRSK